MTSAEQVRLDTVPFADSTEALAEIGRAVTSARVARWTVPRSIYRPEITTMRGPDGNLVAAALTSARPSTAATKIVDLWVDTGASAGAGELLLDEIIARARDRGDAAVKWEVSQGSSLPAFAAARGFAPMRRPWAAAGTESAAGFVLWLREIDHDEPGYYAQTTLFTCGAVAALIAAETRGATGFAGSASDRDLEIDFWRQASNFPACEPVGLAVALGRWLDEPGVEVGLDVDGPTLLEEFTGFDRDFRAELQRESVRHAGALGIPIRRDRIGVTEVLQRVAGAEVALLLIDEEPMHEEVGPHWVIAHAADGDVALIEDPWINIEAGETWVDTHDLPVHAAQLDRMVRWSSDGYRGVVFAPGVSA